MCGQGFVLGLRTMLGFWLLGLRASKVWRVCLLAMRLLLTFLWFGGNDDLVSLTAWCDRLPGIFDEGWSGRYGGLIINALGPLLVVMRRWR